MKEERDVDELLASYGFHDIVDVFQRADVMRFWEKTPLIGVCKVSSDFRFLEVNEVVCRILGKSYGGLLGKSFVEITPEPLRSMDEANSIKVREGYIREYVLAKYYEPESGKYVFVVIHPVSAVMPEGSFSHYWTLILPVTEEEYIRIQRKNLGADLLPEGYSATARKSTLSQMMQVVRENPKEAAQAIIAFFVISALVVEGLAKHYGLSAEELLRRVLPW